MHLEIDRLSYFAYFTSLSCPGNRWRLWAPECFVFNADRLRSPMRTAPAWTRSGAAWTVWGEAGPEAGYAARMELTIEPRPAALGLRLQVQNFGELEWSDYANAAFCLSNEEAEDFADSHGERTFVVDLQGQVCNVAASVDPTRSMEEAIPLYNHFPVGARSDERDAAQRFHIATGRVARQNKAKTKTLVFKWDRAARVDVNFNAMSCLHSHPAIGPLVPGRKVSRTGTITIHDAPPKECL